MKSEISELISFYTRESENVKITLDNERVQIDLSEKEKKYKKCEDILEIRAKHFLCEEIFYV